MAANYAILNSKPLNILTSNELEKSIYKKSINNYANYFKKEKINISNEPKLNRRTFFSINKKAYKSYKQQCIVPTKSNGFDVHGIIKKSLIS